MPNAHSLYLYPFYAALGHKGRKEASLTKTVIAEKNLHVVKDCAFYLHQNVENTWPSSVTLWLL